MINKEQICHELALMCAKTRLGNVPSGKDIAEQYLKYLKEIESVFYKPDDYHMSS